MTREQAIQIAQNFYTFRYGMQPEELTLQKMESANGRCVIRTTAYNSEEGENSVYEIEIDPISNSVTMKQVVAEFDASDFIQQPKNLSAMEVGDLFRMESDCVVWRYCGTEQRFGDLVYGVSRKNACEINLLSHDKLVYPCGK